MKRIMSLVFILALLVTSVACGDSKGEAKSSDSSVSVASAVGKYQEAPQLSQLVKDGKLPSVDQRLPDEPLVSTAKEVGKYGGVYKGAAFGPKSGQADEETLRQTGLLKFEPDLKTFTPFLLKEYQVSDDMKEYTFILRKGLKWSNGDPLTADDFMFWYEDILMNKDIQPSVTNAGDYQVDGQFMKMEKIDEFTVKCIFDKPNPSFDIIMVKNSSTNTQPRNFFAPKNYLKQYHIKYNPDAETLAKNEGYSSWTQGFLAHTYNSADATDTNAPDITPWVLTKIDDQGNRYYDRNPYYFAVDKDGNQLPYIDQQQSVIVKDAQVRILKLISGELHAAAENPLPVKDYTLYKENEQKGNYKVMLWGNTRGADAFTSFNLTHKDPVLRSVFNEVKFRQAMSIAINRDEINKTLYFGKGEIRQAVPPANTSFYEDWMGKYMVEYNPDKANQLLDELGYKWDAGHTVRLMPNGKPFNVVLETFEEFVPVSQMITEYFTKVGIKATLKQQERNFLTERGKSNDTDAVVGTLNLVQEFALRSRKMGQLNPVTDLTESEFRNNWKIWFTSNGQGGEEPPKEVQELYQKCLTFSTLKPGSDEYMKLGKEVLTTTTNNLWMLGTVVSPRVVIISNKLGNTPTEGTFAYDYNFWNPYKGDSWYFK